MIPVLGVLTIGESPRPDALTSDMQRALGGQFRLVERGALDGLPDAEIEGLAPGPDDYILVTLRASGSPVQVGKQKILSLIQKQIQRLEQEDGVVGTLLMCTGAFPPFQHSRMLLRPQDALYRTVLGLAAGGRPASLIPLEAQFEQSGRKWQEYGVHDAVIVPAEPYGPDSMTAVADGARRARELGASVLFMDCFGYNSAMKQVARESFGGPVILARSMAARLLAEVAT